MKGLLGLSSGPPARLISVGGVGARSGRVHRVSGWGMGIVTSAKHGRRADIFKQYPVCAPCNALQAWLHARNTYA
jgi:hypothetical protein